MRLRGAHLETHGAGLDELWSEAGVRRLYRTVGAARRRCRRLASQPLPRRVAGRPDHEPLLRGPWLLLAARAARVRSGQRQRRSAWPDDAMATTGAATGFFGITGITAPSAYAETLADSLGLNKLASNWSALGTSSTVRRPHGSALTCRSAALRRGAARAAAACGDTRSARLTRPPACVGRAAQAAGAAGEAPGKPAGEASGAADGSDDAAPGDVQKQLKQLTCVRAVRRMHAPRRAPPACSQRRAATRWDA